MKKLLADGSTNKKMAKNSIKTYGLSLLPHTLNSKGENLCKYSTKECRDVCLNTSGMGKFNNVQKARLKKANYFVNDKSSFIKQLWKELQNINKKGKSAVRLNVISDVDWETEFSKEGFNLATLDNIIFYSYTKNPYMIELNTNPNHHFTFSYSGGNWNWCDKFLKEDKANVAVVFKNDLPLEYKGWKVINGDLSDERFNDPHPVIVGLKYKRSAGKVDNAPKFVVNE